MATAPKKPSGPFGGYRTRQEQLDAQEAASSVMPEDEPMYADRAYGKRKGKKTKKSGKGSWPW